MKNSLEINLPRDSRFEQIEKKENKNSFSSVELVKYKKRDAPHISSKEAKEKLQTAKKIEIVVHPLYSLLGENMARYDQRMDGFDNTLSDVILEQGCREGLLYACKDILHHISQGIDQGVKCPLLFFKLQDIVSELANYEKEPGVDTVRIFMLPGKENGGYSSKVIDAYNSFLQEFANDQSFIIESQDFGNGNFKIADIAFLDKFIQSSTIIEVQGGYIGGCVSDAINGDRYGVESLEDVSRRNNNTLLYDLFASTESIAGANVDLSLEDVSEHLHIELVAPDGDIDSWSWKEISSFMSENMKTIDAYHSFLADHAKNNKGVVGGDTVDIIKTRDMDEWVEQQLRE